MDVRESRLLRTLAPIRQYNINPLGAPRKITQQWTSPGSRSVLLQYIPFLTTKVRLAPPIIVLV